LPAPVAADPPGLDLLEEARAAGIDQHQSAGGNGNRAGTPGKPRGRK
jgi:hypothetical protein